MCVRGGKRIGTRTEEEKKKKAVRQSEFLESSASVCSRASCCFNGPAARATARQMSGITVRVACLFLLINELFLLRPQRARDKESWGGREFGLGAVD